MKNELSPRDILSLFCAGLIDKEHARHLLGFDDDTATPRVTTACIVELFLAKVIDRDDALRAIGLTPMVVSPPVPVPPIVPESDLTPLRFIDIPATLFKNAVALVKRSGCEINDCSVAGCLRAAAEMANGLGYLCGSESSLTFSRLSESPTDIQGTDR